MLLIETRVAGLSVGKGLRTSLLEALQGRGLTPLIRAARMSFFEQAAGDAAHARELERAVAGWTDAEGIEPYVRGDVFCSEEFAHFLVFADESEGGGLRAGIVYDAETAEPARRLEEFCRSVGEAYEEAARGARAEGSAGGVAENGSAAAPFCAAVPRVEWRRREGRPQEVFKRFASSTDAPEATSSTGARGAMTAERMRAVEILEDSGARGFLQRLSEAHADGRVSEMLAAEGRSPEREALVSRLTGSGLARREVQISCRKNGRSLFRLPSTDALAIVTASNAVCSECGTAIADERAEELVTPTPLASSMMKGGEWLVSRLRSILVGLGVPESETATRDASDEGEPQVLANVGGEPFLFVVRDGDFSASDARRALEGEADAQAARLVVVSTGKIQDEARARLREHARRRSRAGGASEVIFVEGLDSAAGELGAALERIAQDALTRELYELDAGAGFSVGYALATRFRLARHGGLQDLAASAAGALSGSLREF
ncbi:MAG TPA: hypothetical protein VM914_06985 [Pyrinomonadaceae bacterium]|jgi:hypothetical protein|nr:hypothetical protein [Pyrinomonadaceae bacterium]